VTFKVGCGIITPDVDIDQPIAKEKRKKEAEAIFNDKVKNASQDDEFYIQFLPKADASGIAFAVVEILTNTEKEYMKAQDEKSALDCVLLGHDFYEHEGEEARVVVEEKKEEEATTAATESPLYSWFSSMNNIAAEVPAGFDMSGASSLLDKLKDKTSTFNAVHTAANLLAQTNFGGTYDPNSDEHRERMESMKREIDSRVSGLNEAFTFMSSVAKSAADELLPQVGPYVKHKIRMAVPPTNAKELFLFALDRVPILGGYISFTMRKMIDDPEGYKEYFKGKFDDFTAKATIKFTELMLSINVEDKESANKFAEGIALDNLKSKRITEIAEELKKQELKSYAEADQQIYKVQKEMFLLNHKPALDAKKATDFGGAAPNSKSQLFNENVAFLSAIGRDAKVGKKPRDNSKTLYVNITESLRYMPLPLVQFKDKWQGSDVDEIFTQILPLVTENINPYLAELDAPVSENNLTDTARFDNALLMLKIARCGVVYSNNEFYLHPHYVRKSPTEYEYYLPVVYPTTEAIMYNLVSYLEKKNQKYIWMNSSYPTSVLDDMFKYGSSFTYPISKTDNGNPVCVIISPDHTEGFSFTFNPIFIAPALCRTSGDEEQAYGRILRKYNEEGYNGQYNKKFYQYFGASFLEVDNLRCLANKYGTDKQLIWRDTQRSKKFIAVNDAYYKDPLYYGLAHKAINLGTTLKNQWTTLSGNATILQAIEYTTAIFKADEANVTGQSTINITRQQETESNEKMAKFHSNTIYPILSEEYHLSTLNEVRNLCKTYFGMLVEKERLTEEDGTFKPFDSQYLNSILGPTYCQVNNENAILCTPPYETPNAEQLSSIIKPTRKEITRQYFEGITYQEIRNSLKPLMEEYAINYPLLATAGKKAWYLSLMSDLTTGVVKVIQENRFPDLYNFYVREQVFFEKFPNFIPSEFMLQFAVQYEVYQAYYKASMREITAEMEDRRTQETKDRQDELQKKLKLREDNVKEGELKNKEGTTQLFNIFLTNDEVKTAYNLFIEENKTDLEKFKQLSFDTPHEFYVNTLSPWSRKVARFNDSYVGQAVSTVFGVAKSVVGSVVGAVAQPFQPLTRPIASAALETANLGAQGVEIVKGLPGQVKDVAVKGADAVQEGVRRGVSAVESGVQASKDVVQSGIDTVKTGIKSGVETASNVAEAFTDTTEILQQGTTVADDVTATPTKQWQWTEAELQDRTIDELYGIALSKGIKPDMYITNVNGLIDKLKSQEKGSEKSLKDPANGYASFPNLKSIFNNRKTNTGTQISEMSFTKRYPTQVKEAIIKIILEKQQTRGGRRTRRRHNKKNKKGKSSKK
jgi:hypothetical protein